jgi:hypothetical protein
MLTIEPTGAVLGATVRAWTWRGRSTKATWRILLALGRQGYCASLNSSSTLRR